METGAEKISGQNAIVTWTLARRAGSAMKLLLVSDVTYRRLVRFSTPSPSVRRGPARSHDAAGDLFVVRVTLVHEHVARPDLERRNHPDFRQDVRCCLGGDNEPGLNAHPNIGG